ncbi:MAG: ABC transporter ATP-binding protein [Mycoplasmataceae bacterium]|nr:ABC transporter ATP-binding protein [Mycoplasmataceae bacterium]
MPRIKKNINKEYAIQMSHITKTFADGKIYANNNLSFNVLRGEIHAIVGENGAGKSTLMSILFGIYQPDQGEIMINGKVCNFKSPRDAVINKIGMVHQHFKLVGIYTLLDNIILGAETTKFGVLDKKTAATKINTIAKQYKLAIDLSTRARDASVGEQQRVEILKLLYRDVNILIFDEPTAVLSDKEISAFLQMLLTFKKQGKTVILITHKLNEVKAVADRVSIIRSGLNAGTFDVKTTSTSRMASLMVGKKMQFFKNKITSNVNKTAPLLSVKELTIANAEHKNLDKVKNISFDVSPGEILGIAGIEGNGQSELALALAGIIKPKSGTMTLYSNVNKQALQIEKNSIKNLYQNGIAHVPEDRHKHGLILDETVAMNVVSCQIDQPPFSRFGFINRHAINNYSKKICIAFDVHGTTDGLAFARSLSGGNQQKLILGRELTRPHQLLILVQPVRGLDAGAINKIHQAIVNDAKKGTAVILISYEIDELLNVATRVAIMDEGKIVYDRPTHLTSKATIGKYLSRSFQSVS